MRLVVRKGRSRSRAAFTLVEISIVVAIIGILATIAIPGFMRARTVAKGVRVANDLRVFGAAFALYAMENGQYPPDAHESLPSVPNIDQYIDRQAFYTITVFGGRYNWEGPDFYPYAGVSVSGTSISNEELLKIDAVVDDGNLGTGRYIRASNGRYTYIIE